MDTVALVVSGIASVLALGAFGVTLWMITHQPSDVSVTALAHELKRSRKAEAMRVVREAAAEAREASAPLGADGKPLSFGPVAPVLNTKAELRKRVFGTMQHRGGNGNEHT